MSTMSFPSLRVDGLTLILGLGETGVAAALWCARHGAHLRVLDTRAEPGGLSALQSKLGAAHVDFRRSEEHTSELQSLMRISYAVFCLQKKTKKQQSNTQYVHHRHT